MAGGSAQATVKQEGDGGIKEEHNKPSGTWSQGLGRRKAIIQNEGTHLVGFQYGLGSGGDLLSLAERTNSLSSGKSDKPSPAPLHGLRKLSLTSRSLAWHCTQQKLDEIPSSPGADREKMGFRSSTCGLPALPATQAACQHCRAKAGHWVILALL